jgi:perosamine synthetase
MYSRIHLDAPDIGALEKRYINAAIDSGYISSIGPDVAKFEEKCAGYLGAERAVSTNSGTAALHIALYELGIGSGDEVILPPLTFIATVNPVVYVGATPVFADVNPETWNLDPEAVERAVTNRTKAIIPVHLYGNPCDMDAIERIAERHGLFVIEDAAESLGARYGEKFTGTLGDFGCISFNGNKTITTGGGGMVIGNDRGRLDHIKYLINQAKDDGHEMYHSEIGFNYRMTNIQAALGLAQFERLEAFLSRKREINCTYRAELGGLKNISFQKEYDRSESSWWFTCILTEDPKMREDLQQRLSEKGVPTRRVFAPASEFPPFKGARFIDYGNAHSIHDRGICLPSSTLNDVTDIKKVCSALKEICCEAITAY